MSLKHILESLITFYAQDGQASILAGLGHSEKHRPQDTLCCHADGEHHLSERQYIKWYTTQQHDDSSPE